MSMPVVTADMVVPATDPSGRIFQTVKGVVDGYANYFEERDVALPVDASGRTIAFVSDGALVIDQALFSVEVMALRPGTPGTPDSRPIGAGSQYILELGLALIREVPTLDTDGVPHPDAREKAARAWLLDWSVLYDGAREMTARAMAGDRRTFTGAPYRRVMIQSMAPYGPEGLFGGVIGTLEVEIV